MEAGENSLVFNLHLLTFINSSALGYLLKVKKRAQELGGDLVLVQPSKFIRKTLLTLGLQEVFNIYETDEDGVLSFLKPGGGKGPALRAHQDRGEPGRVRRARSSRARVWVWQSPGIMLNSMTGASNFSRPPQARTSA